MNPTFPENLTFLRRQNLEFSRNVGFLATFCNRQANFIAEVRLFFNFSSHARRH